MSVSSITQFSNRWKMKVEIFMAKKVYERKCWAAFNPIQNSLYAVSAGVVLLQDSVFVFAL